MTILRFAAVLIATLLMGSRLPIYAQAATANADAPPTFRTLHMVSKTEGWAVVTVPDPKSSSGIPGQIYPGSFAYVLHTKDSGFHWANVTPTLSTTLTEQGGYGCDCSDNGVAGVFFLDESHAWLLTNDAGIPGNQIFYGIGIRATSDGGQSWQESVEGLNNPFVIGSSFVDAMHGWMLLGGIPEINSEDQPTHLYQTLDGGMTWKMIADDGTYPHYDHNSRTMVEPISPLATSITPKQHEDMVFESESGGWMLAEYIDPPIGGLLHTTDSGVTWKTVDTPETPDDQECGLSDLKLGAPGEILFMASCYPQRTLYESSDDGKSWQSNPIPANLFHYSDWPQHFMLNMTTGWALGCDTAISAENCDKSAAPFLYQTTNGGKTWDNLGGLPEALTPATLDYGLQIVPKFDFVDAQTGWVIDPAGGLMATNDGGKSWTAIETAVAGL